MRRLAAFLIVELASCAVRKIARDIGMKPH